MYQKRRLNPMKLIIILAIALIVIGIIAGGVYLAQGGLPDHLQQVLP